MSLSNDQIILDRVLDQKREEVAAGLTESGYFERFTAEQILKDYDLSYDEIEQGIVDGGGDGQIDSIFLFINGEIVQEDTDVSVFKKDVVVDLIFIQSKISRGFAETAVDQLRGTVDELLDLSKKLDDLATGYNEDLIEVMRRFRATYDALASRFPKLRFSFYYASRGVEVHPNVKRKADGLVEHVKKLFSSCESTFHFVGAAELLALARRTATTAFSLNLAETPISSSGTESFICLVRMRDYFAFISDEVGKLRRNIFEANVRDYQGDVQVNSGIQETLRGDRQEDFWWLNNGITIVATKASHGGKALTIENPNVVNGLQTSTEIYNYFRTSDTKADERNVLIRVIVPPATQSRDRIIKATNSQTYIPSASLRATEPIHRSIEEYLKPHGIFYDRRKNFYKNEGKPIDKIISIGQLAQGVMAILLQRPNDARARPSSLLNADADYKAIFNTDYPIPLYKVCATLMKKTEAFLRAADLNLPLRDQNNLKFHLAMLIGGVLTKKAAPSVQDIAKLEGVEVDVATLSDNPRIVKEIYEGLGSTDQIAKGASFVEQIKEHMRTALPDLSGKPSKHG